MDKGFWQKRLSRRRLLGATSLAIAGGGAGLFLPRRLARTAAQAPFVRAEDIRHTPAELATGRLQGMTWDSPAGQPVLRAVSTSGGVYTSPVVKTSFPATHIGLHWRADDPKSDQVLFELRASTDGWTWSPWQRLYIEAEPEQNPHGERFAALVSTAGATHVQYRATLPADTPDATALRTVTVTALAAALPTSPLVAARATRTPTPRPTAGSTPAPTHDAGELDPPFSEGVLIPRETWGAPESYRYDSRGYEVWPRMYLPTKKVIVHHTADPETPPNHPSYPYPAYDADQAVQYVRSVYHYHAITLGWGDIGYNALIDRFGRVFEGRIGRDNGPHGGREIISPDVVAGHALNWNEGTAGVSLIGNYESNQLGSNEQTMLDTLVELVTWWCRRYYVWPNASSDFLQVNWVWRQGVQNIAGHRDVNWTACPGQYLYVLLPDIRRRIAQRAAAVAVIKPSAQITSLPNQAELDRGSATFTWKSPDNSAAEFSYYLEGWIPNLDTDEDYYVTGFTGDKRPDWSSFGSATSATLKLPQAARYTFHVRARDSKSDGAYEANWTFVATNIGPTPPAPRPIGVPGIIKN
jgi:N-acetylmuramoyl-L-alanine amidase